MISDLLLGNDNAKTIEILIENNDEWLEPEEIAKMSGNTIDEVYELVMFLMNMGVINESDEEKYKLNMKNPIAKTLFILENTMISEGLKKRLAEMQKERIMLGKVLDLEECVNDGKHWTHKDLSENTMYIIKRKDSPWLLGTFTHYGPPYATFWLFNPTWGATSIQLSYGNHPKEDDWIYIQEVVEVKPSEQQKGKEK